MVIITKPTHRATVTHIQSNLIMLATEGYVAVIAAVLATARSAAVVQPVHIHEAATDALLSEYGDHALVSCFRPRPRKNSTLAWVEL